MFTIDPDVPSFLNSRVRSFKHWLVVNIPGTNVTAGKTLDRYIKPVPKPSSGKLTDWFKKFNVVMIN